VLAVASPKTGAGGATIASHFGFADSVKSREQQMPLWCLMLATARLDIVLSRCF
jgi:hypothetical protein